MEQLALTTPSTPPPITSYAVSALHIDRDGLVVEITVRPNAGVSLVYRAVAIEAANLISALNTANLSVKSLQRRCLEYLVGKGFLSGSVTGTPD